MIINSLRKLRVFIFTQLLLLLALKLYSQTPTPAALSGNGTENEPYLITSTADWNAFAEAVNNGYAYSDQFVKLDADISVTEMVGNKVDLDYCSFEGIFDGDGNILTFTYDYSTLPTADRLDHVAPFRYINGATIKNLNVAGLINMNKSNAGGLFCVNDINDGSVSYITDCTVSVTMSGYKDYCGGFANDAKNVEFTRCIYNGKINVGRYSGGFSSTGNKTTIVNNCLCAPAAGSEIYRYSGNFVGDKNAIVSADSHYTLVPNMPEVSYTNQGTRAYTSEPPAVPAVFTKYQQLIDNNYYYTEGNATIIGLHHGYTYTGSEIDVVCGMTFEGEPLTQNVDYSMSVSPMPVLEDGEYTMTLNGVNDNGFYGSISQSFRVIDGLIGHGTEESPYLINDADDWRIFADIINLGVDVDKYYKLTSDITVGSELSPINYIVGADEDTEEDERFKGHFDGDFHTITMYMQRTEPYAAPFGVIENAVIENLAVTGKIKTSHKYAAGIAAYTYGIDTIRSCFSSVIIDCSDIKTFDPGKPGDCTHGGLVGQVGHIGGDKLDIENCIFNGSIIDTKEVKTAQRCAGFCGYREVTLTYTNCTMAGTIDIYNDKATFHRNGHGTFTKAYYITPSNQGSNQGVEITSSAAPTDGIYRKYTVSDNDYYVPGGIITGIEKTTFSYSGEVIDIDPTITYYGWTLNEGSDYNKILTYSTTEQGDYTPVDEIREAGYYKLALAGTGVYGGSIVYDIRVFSIDTWSELKVALTTEQGEFKLYKDYIAGPDDEALVVLHNIVLDMNGHVINRNRTESEDAGYVFKVESGANLTIENGRITGGKDNGSGGGIYNLGTLTLNEVVIINNASTETGGGIYCHTGSRFNMNGGGVINNQTTGHGGSNVPAGGGGIHANEVIEFVMNNVVVTQNTTNSKGGGIRLKTGNITTSINNCVITNNVVTDNSNAQSKGGGIFFEQSSNNTAILNVTGGMICENSVKNEGGGIYIMSGIVSIQNCDVLGNMSSDMGGAVSLYSGSANHPNRFIMDGGSMSGNQSDNKGGGVYVRSNSILEINDNAQIIGNNSKTTDADNVYLAGGNDKIQIDGDVSSALIGVSRDATGAITSGLSGYGTEYNFISDSGSHWVILNEGEAYLQNYYIWGVTEGWPNLEGITKEGEDYNINAVVAIPENTVATANSITTGVGLLIIEDGGQLVTGSTSSAKTRMKKTIEGTTADDNGWYLIASPVANPKIASATNLITTGVNKYDLYRYNEASDLQWENYRAGHADFTTLENGRGYLYRNLNDCVIEINGDLNAADVNYTLSYTSSSELKGFNIIGNPYSHTIYKGASTSAIPNGGLLEEKYYTLSQDGEWVLTDDGSAIPPMTGILVQAKSAGTLTMKNSTEGQVTPSRSSDGKNIWVTVANGNYEDRACVEFKEGRGLNKIAHQNKDVPMLYIRHNDEDFASVDVNPAERSLNLSFEAKTTGYYTLSMQTQGEFGYLHLFDKLTGSDVDMLQEKEYSFIGSVADNADRFLVRLCPLNDTGTFAYQSGDDIIVEGVGELEVFDVMGRMVMKRQINGIETVCESSLQTGIYILRLEGKTQKIVVR